MKNVIEVSNSLNNTTGEEQTSLCTQVKCTIYYRNRLNFYSRHMQLPKHQVKQKERNLELQKTSFLVADHDCASERDGKLALYHVNPVFYKGGNREPDTGLNKNKKAIHMKTRKKYLTYSLKIEV